MRNLKFLVLFLNFSKILFSLRLKVATNNFLFKRRSFLKATGMKSNLIFVESFLISDFALFIRLAFVLVLEF